MIPDNAIGAIMFNTRHTWAVRKHSEDGNFWKHDSLREATPYVHRSTKAYAALYCFLK